MNNIKKENNNNNDTKNQTDKAAKEEKDPLKDSTKCTCILF